MKIFQIKTKSDLAAAEFIFYTKARNGKEALKSLIEQSSDFRNILKNKESNNMTITIKHDP